MAGELAGKVAVVTGGANGIGRGIVALFQAEDAKVVFGDIDDDAGAAFEGEFRGDVIYHHADVLIESDIESLVQRAVDEFGSLDVMVNNAGALGDQTTFLDLDAEGYTRTLNLLLRSVALGHKYAGRRFAEQGTGGSIVSIASVAAIMAGLSSPSYDASKAAMIQMARTATHELGPYRVRSNVILPGLISTALPARGTDLDPSHYPEFAGILAEEWADMQPVGRGGRPEDIGNMAVFLASDRSEFVTGQSIAVDGGLTSVTTHDIAAAVGRVFDRMGMSHLDPTFSSASKARQAVAERDDESADKA